MVSIGIRYYGLANKVNDEHVPNIHYYYETRESMSDNPPTGQELDFLNYIKQQIETKEHVTVNFASVEEDKLTVQWRSLGSPISVGIIIAIIAIVITLFALSSVIHETYQLASVLGSETIGQIFEIIALVFMLTFMSSIISTVTGFMPKRRRES